MSIEEGLEALYPIMVEWRRHLHENPELSYQEVNTSRFIADRLESFGLEVRRGVGGHGVIGLLRGREPGPTVALRADMDALPIQDEKSCEYKSKVSGVMHACGHDGHTSSLLGAARLLGEMKDQLKGNVKFLFQAAEEVTPGGALPMIADGALDGVHAIYGVHLWTPFPTGSVYCRPGAMMASADEFILQIKGKGGHGGLPHTTVDSLLIGAQLVVNLQTIVSRNVDPTLPGVVTVGSFHAGKGFNVIADTCFINGTSRAFDAETRDLIQLRITEIANHTCSMYGAEHEFEFKWGYPFLINHASDYERFRRVGTGLFGQSRTLECPMIMAAEDFAYYLEKVPGCYMFVGAGNADKGVTAPHHHPKFDIDEQAMKMSVRLLAGMAIDYLNEHAG